MGRFDAIIALIHNGKMSRAELASVSKNAIAAAARGDNDAQKVLEALASGIPTDRYVIFMGYCPGGNVQNRRDLVWKETETCTFDFHKSTHQMGRFRSICPGDLIVLKKRQEFGRTMRLCGFGRVRSLAAGPSGDRMLQMNWSNQNNEIEVPLMACNDTVNLRAMSIVEQQMPPAFWTWLEL